MPFKLYVKLIDVFIKFYHDKQLNSDMAVAIANALIPICNDIENGKYDLKRDTDE